MRDFGKKLGKFIALRALLLIMAPYSASAAAGTCSSQLDYSLANAPDIAYETVAYKPTDIDQTSKCLALQEDLSAASLVQEDRSQTL